MLTAAIYLYINNYEKCKLKQQMIKPFRPESSVIPQNGTCDWNDANLHDLMVLFSTKILSLCSFPVLLPLDLSVLRFVPFSEAVYLLTCTDYHSFTRALSAGILWSFLTVFTAFTAVPRPMKSLQLVPFFMVISISLHVERLE